jgi:hypothetical protein
VKPTNKNPDLLLEDGEPAQCRFYARSDQPPSFMERCETHATLKLPEEYVAIFKEWRERHQQAIIGLLPGQVHLCDTHNKIVMDCVFEV